MLHRLPCKVARLARAVAAEDKQLRDALREFLPQLRISRIRPLPGGIQPAIAPRVFDHTGDLLLPLAVNGKQLRLRGGNFLALIPNNKASIGQPAFDLDERDNWVLRLGDHGRFKRGCKIFAFVL